MQAGHAGAMQEIKNMKIFENLLPFLAPTPAGMVVGIRMYQEIIAAIGPEALASWPEWSFIAAFGAVAGCVAMVGAEMTAYKYAGIGLADGDKIAAVVSVVAGLICSGLFIFAVATSDNARPLVSAVIVGIALFVAQATRDYLARRKANAARQTGQEVATQAAQTDNQVKLLEAKAAADKAAAESQARILEAQAKLANAEKNKTRAQAVRDGLVPVRAVRREQNEHEQNSRSLGADKIAAIRAYQTANPGATVRQVAEAVGVSVGSVAKYGGAK